MSDDQIIPQQPQPQTGGPVAKPRRRIDPYDLSSSDNPGHIISQPQLRGPNYDEWALNIRLALRARKKFGFADGSIPKPDERSGDLEDWWANLPLHQILKRFSVKNGQRVQRIKTELATCQQKGLAIEAYYGKLTKLWTSLADFQRARTAEEIAKEREEDKLHQFLMGLDESLFGAVKSSLLSRDPLPSLDEAYQVVSQDEESKSLGRMREERHDGVSFAVQTSSRPRQQTELRDPSVVCSLCGRTGHVAINCFRKIGYPTWWKDRPRPKLSSSHETSNEAGGDAKGLLSTPKPKEPARANHLMTTSAPSSAVNAMVSNADRVGISDLNDQQWKTLVTMLNDRTPGSHDRLSGPHKPDADWSW